MANYSLIGNSAFTSKVATTIATTNIIASTTGKSATFVLGNSMPWKIVSVCCTCITTATVGTRHIGFMITDSGGNLVTLSSGPTSGALTQVASTTVYYNFAGGVSEGNSNTQFAGAPLPVDCIIPPNSTISFVDRTATDAADTVSFYVSFLT